MEDLGYVIVGGIHRVQLDVEMFEDAARHKAEFLFDEDSWDNPVISVNGTQTVVIPLYCGSRVLSQDVKILTEDQEMLRLTRKAIKVFLREPTYPAAKRALRAALKAIDRRAAMKAN